MSKRLAMTGFMLALAVALVAPASAQPTAAEEPPNPFAQSTPTTLPYDKEYPGANAQCHRAS